MKSSYLFHSKIFTCFRGLAFASVAQLALALPAFAQSQIWTIDRGTAPITRATDSFRSALSIITHNDIELEPPLGVPSCHIENICLRALSQGDVDIASINFEEIRDVFPTLDLLNLPFAFGDPRVAHAMLQGDTPLISALRTHISSQSDKSLRLLAITPIFNGTHILIKGTPAIKPDMFAFKRIATGLPEFDRKRATDFGGFPVPTPIDDYAVAFDTDAIDVAFAPPEMIRPFLDQRKMDYSVSLEPMTYDLMFWIMRQDKFETTTETTRGHIGQAVFHLQTALEAEFQTQSLAFQKDVQRASAQAFSVKATDQRAFRENTRALQDWATSLYPEAEKIIAALQDEFDRAQKETDALRAGSLE